MVSIPRRQSPFFRIRKRSAARAVQLALAPKAFVWQDHCFCSTCSWDSCRSSSFNASRIRSCKCSDLVYPGRVFRLDAKLDVLEHASRIRESVQKNPISRCQILFLIFQIALGCSKFPLAISDFEWQQDKGMPTVLAISFPHNKLRMPTHVSFVGGLWAYRYLPTGMTFINRFLRPPIEINGVKTLLEGVNEKEIFS